MHNWLNFKCNLQTCVILVCSAVRLGLRLAAVNFPPRPSACEGRASHTRAPWRGCAGRKAGKYAQIRCGNRLNSENILEMFRQSPERAVLSSLVILSSIMSNRIVITVRCQRGFLPTRSFLLGRSEVNASEERCKLKVSEVVHDCPLSNYSCF